MRKLRAEVQVLFVHQIPDPQRPELTIQSSWQQYFQSGIVSDATVVPLTSYHSDRSATPFLHVLGVTTVSLQYQDSASSVSEHMSRFPIQSKIWSYGTLEKKQPKFVTFPHSE